ncbi:hypothetical protein EB077_05580, partial [bacterium]|nr:hypothetical protein [bacterium]
CPTPQTLQQLIQFILDKVCALSNQSGTSINAGCPDCEVPIAACFQEPDFLGNQIVSLQLKDYVIKIGNEICSILTAITTLQTSVADLDARVTYIETNCCNQGPTNITVSTASCISGVSGLSIVDFATQLETAFCALQTRTGTPLALYDAISYECAGLAGSAPLDPNSTDPTMSAISGWTVGAQNLAQSFTNMWLTICDLRAAVAQLQTDLAACCSVSCEDIVWSFTATGINGSKFIEPTFTGTIPAGFSYCSGSTTGIVVTDALGGTATYNEDVIDAINNGTQLQLDATVPPSITEQSVWYQLDITLCVTDGTLSCTKSRSYSFYNTNWCTALSAAISTLSSSSVQVDWTAVLPSTTYLINLYQGTTLISSQTVTGAVGPSNVIFTGLTAATVYSAQIVSTQGVYSITCNVGVTQTSPSAP